MEKETKGWRNCIFFRRSEKLVHLIWDSQLFALCCYSLIFWGLLLLKAPSTEIRMFLEDRGFESFFMFKKGWSWCVVRKKCFFTKNGLLNWYSQMIFFWKNSVDFWHRKLTLKVRFWHFLTNWCSLYSQNTTVFFWACQFLGKKLVF